MSLLRKLYQLTVSILLVFGFANTVSAQTANTTKRNLSEFVLLAGRNSPGTVTINSSVTINGGSIGAFSLVQTGSSDVINSNIYSADRIIIGSSNTIKGNLSAAANYPNSPITSGTILQVGSSSVTGNSDAFGNVSFGGPVTGTITIPPSATFSPSSLASKVIKGTPNLQLPPSAAPDLPDPFVISTTTYPVVTTTITGNISPGPGSSSGNINYSGNKKLTLLRPGTYVFNSIKMTGNSNELVFDFDNKPGNYKVYIRGNADFGKLNVTVLRGDPSTAASRIYFEVQGNGLGTSIVGNSFIINNGSSGGGSKWLGTVYATDANGGINVGSGTGSSSLSGAFWSRKAVTIQSGVSVTYAQFIPCIPPVVKAGIMTGSSFTEFDSIPLDFSGHTELTAQLTGGSFSWQATKGGIITSANTNTATIQVGAAGTYIVSAYTNDAGCVGKDSVVVAAKVHNLIGGELLSIYQNYDPNNPELDSFFVTDDGYVMIDIICRADKDTHDVRLELIQTPQYGLRNVLPNGLSEHTITGEFPVINLLNLNARGDILQGCKPYYLPGVNGGLVVSQGDTTMRSYLVRKGYSRENDPDSLDGRGVKIAVISDSYGTLTAPLKNTLSDPCSGVTQTLNVNTAANDATEKEVTKLTIVEDFPIKRTDEGRAMMQIVDDLAPGADKYFQTGVFTAGYLAKSIEKLAAMDIKVMVDDVTYPDQPMLSDGIVAKTIDKVRADFDVFYATSAGNFGRRSYTKQFNGGDATGIGFPGKRAHNFGNDANGNPVFFQRVMLKPGTTFLVFQWLDDNFSQGEGTGARYDLDIYLTPGDKTDGTGLIGYNRMSIGFDAVEFIPYTVPGGPCDPPKPYNILIINNSSANPLMKYVVFKGESSVVNPQYDEGNSTTVGHSNAVGAFTVGAVRFDHVKGHPFAPSGIQFPQIESFSSLGGNMNRLKPDGSGADGGDVTVLMGPDYPAQAKNGRSNFFGTSAAAPHVAACAVLIKQARIKYLNQQTSPDEMKSLLQTTATPMRPPNSPGYDYLGGAGLINVEAAIRTFAVPKPYEISLSFDQSLLKEPDIVPCLDSFVLTIKGENFSSNTKVYVVEAPGDSTKLTPFYVSATRDTVKVKVQACLGNAQILAFTDATVRNPVTGAEDGGFSNSIKLFSREIVVKTNDAIRTYGQVNPTFTTTITVDGKPIGETDLTLEEVGLQASKLTGLETNATDAYTDIGNYAVKVYRNFDRSIPADALLLDSFRYVFRSGNMRIDPLPITITPKPITATYGNYIGEIAFDYAFPQGQPTSLTAAMDTAKKYHEAFLPKNALAVIKDFKKQQADGSVLTNTDLAGLNTMVSFNALANSRKFKIVNSKLVPETDPDTLNTQYIVDVASESFYEFKKDPTFAKFYSGYPGLTKKAVLGEEAIDDYEGEVQVSGSTSLKTLISGYPTLVLNGAGLKGLAPMISGQLITILDGKLATLNSDDELVPIPGSPSIQYLNGTGKLMYLISTGKVEYVEDGSYVVIPNLEVGLHVINGGKLNYLISGTEFPVISTTDVLDDGDGNLINSEGDILEDGSVLSLASRLGLATLISGTGNKTLSPLISAGGIKSLSTLISQSQIQITVTNGRSSLQPLISTEPPGGGGGGGPTNKTAVIFDETDVNETTNNYLGPLFGLNTITGLDVGTQAIVPGKLVNPNFAATYVNGTATIQSDQCLLTHSTFKVFGNTTTVPTSLWLNMTTKVSGQLSQKGDSLVFKGGTVTFNFVTSNPTITNVEIPDGKIIADNVPAPFTRFDANNNIWITKVPIGFASTSDIFMTGAIINSSNGFVKTSNNTSSVLKGRFYSNKTFSDQWAFAIAAYQPQFLYTDIDDSAQVVAINGTYKAGTPLPIISKLVNGGSGGGGNNYTGSKSAYDNFTACAASANPQAASRPLPVTTVVNETAEEKLKGIVKIYPNPANNHVLVSFVPEISGNSKIMVYTIDGRKVLEINNGRTERGMLYLKSLDVSKLTRGVYMLQLWSGDKVTIKKIIIN